MLRMGCGALAAGASGTFARLHAQSGGRRALVCIYLNGGNDSNNMVVPMDPAEYDAYAGARRELALASNELLPIASMRSGAQYGLHPGLGELRDLYQQGKMAIVANTGHEQPGKAAGHHSAGAVDYLTDGFIAPAWASRWSGIRGTGAGAYTFDSGVSLVAPGAPPSGGRRHENHALRLSMEGSISGLSFPNTGLGRGLRDVAALIATGASWGMQRQVLTVPLSGFDTHSGQLARQDRLFRELSQATAAFYRAVESMELAESVLIFTETEFNRSVFPNSTQGTDHGWGGHHLVIGGGVRAAGVYGQFPSFAALGDGSWIPAVSSEQYAAELCGWAGASSDDRQRLFPGSSRALGLLA